MKKLITLLLSSVILISGITGCSQKPSFSPEDPVTLTMWHVFGEQADSPMNLLISEFNETVGKEKGIIVDVTLVSGTTKISTQLLDAQSNKPGSLSMPDLYFCHTSTAAELAESTVNWNDYFTEKELSNFVEGFVQDGMIDGKLTVFPVSKSSYALYINGTQFDQFSKDTGVTYSELEELDSFLDAAAKYHEWSGGKPFCAIDYLIRHVEFEVMSNDGALYTEDGWYDYESAALKEAWMKFARSIVQGHVIVSDLYANTQVMTGETIAGIGSTAAILYYNDTVTYPDNTSEPTNLQVLPIPRTTGKPGLMPQTGVGLCATKTTADKAEAASVFAHWLTESQRNLEFVVHTGYMPVNNGAFESIDIFDFPSQEYGNLYSAIKKMHDSYTPIVRPTYDGFYDRVNALYDYFRQMQPVFAQRIQNGEDPEALAEETWEQFCAIE